ncbi:hypothetical protein DFH94DRAFT_842938 [Russula ochroleuca]|uniref:Uncharacterized protein n=1 Tax=Russula ochroleuca TaxID=152965 RepID=A0A9P5N3B8_9AGAM|nr:hypothetical protein DFH94DRAFT_842938 [Russula ochroleuca]
MASSNRQKGMFRDSEPMTGPVLFCCGAASGAAVAASRSGGGGGGGVRPSVEKFGHDDARRKKRRRIVDDTVLMASAAIVEVAPVAVIHRELPGKCQLGWTWHLCMAHRLGATESGYSPDGSWQSADNMSDIRGAFFSQPSLPKGTRMMALLYSSPSRRARAHAPVALLVLPLFFRSSESRYSTRQHLGQPVHN